MLEVGTKVKNFTLQNQDGEEVSLESISGKKVIYFYPKDSTPGCTVEATTFTALDEEFKALGVSIIGISKDSVKSHNNFVCKQGLTITLLSDPELEVIQYMDVWQEKKMAGRTYMGIVRQTYLLDENNVIIKTYPKVNTKTHASEVLEDIKAL